MDRVREETLVRSFFRSDRQERWLMMLRKPRRRAEALDELNHLAGLDERYTVEVDSLTAAGDMLARLGAPPTCYVMSDVPELDGRIMNLAEALAAAEAGEWGTILDCVPGRLAYYLGERAEIRMVLWRRPT
jgi:hypothetical protein